MLILIYTSATMKIVLASGIYPPEIGGPATYVERLGTLLAERGHQVIVIAYGDAQDNDQKTDGPTVIRVARLGGFLTRWNRYARALIDNAADADIVYCFSLVSVGIPLMLSKITKPKKILRQGGDFLWERYTEFGGTRTIRSFYLTHPGSRSLLRFLLRPYDHVVFSTEFQARLSAFLAKKMPGHSVIENALQKANPVVHQKHDLLKLLFLGRFIKLKNLPTLIRTVAKLPHVELTLVGEGDMQDTLAELISQLHAQTRIRIRQPVSGKDKEELFANHDALILPSYSEISPNVATEARSAGLPVLLTEENGLSRALSEGMIARPLRTSADITRAVLEIDRNYDAFAAVPPVTIEHSWEQIADETLDLFRRLTSQN